MRSRLLGLGLAALFAACSGESADVGGAGGMPPQPPTEPGVVVEPHPRVDTAEQALRAEVAALADLDADAFAAAYPAAPSVTLAYTPHEAAGLDVIQAGALGLSAREQAALDAHGFVVSAEKAFPTFLYGYESIYALDLPVYVTADAVLHAVHHSYDNVLKSLELTSLRGHARSMSTRLRAALAAGGAADYPAATRADLDLYLAVFDSLLHVENVVSEPVAGADAEMVAYLVGKARAAEGIGTAVLFADDRELDFSQFKPRGHYTDDVRLGAYFRAMMWLGRIEFRFLEVDGDTGELELRPRDVLAAYALDALLDAPAREDWRQLDTAIRAFVGDADNLTLPELPRLLDDLGLQKGADLAGVSEQALADALLAGGYGTQQIASQLISNGTGGELPLNRSFLLLGQRYVIDSHVFSNVTWARTKAKRMMPDPLDVAFAALGNNGAGPLLAAELSRYTYWPELAGARTLVDAHAADYWTGNLYTLWLGALRALNVERAVADGLPAVFTGAAWQKRLLNTQLASWAELRHDTLLYAKQSYTDGAVCVFPDAYVEPYPEFWRALSRFGRDGRTLVEDLDFGSATLDDDPVPEGTPESAQLTRWVNRTQALAWFTELENDAELLATMAEHQRTGTPFDMAQMAFINQAIHIDMGCGSPVSADGWLARLYVDPVTAAREDMLVADVHTQPTDEGGTPVGRVLHVGTGWPRLAVFTVETCEGPRAYAGVTSLFHQVVTEDFLRLTDEAWQARFRSGDLPGLPPWMTELAPGDAAALVPSPVE